MTRAFQVSCYVFCVCFCRRCHRADSNVEFSLAPIDERNFDVQPERMWQHRAAVKRAESARQGVDAVLYSQGFGKLCCSWCVLLGLFLPCMLTLAPDRHALFSQLKAVMCLVWAVALCKSRMRCRSLTRQTLISTALTSPSQIKVCAGVAYSAMQKLTKAV